MQSVSLGCKSRCFIRSRRPVTELSGVGPYIARLIREWIKSRPKTSQPPPIRSGFLTINEARVALAAKNQWLSNIKGDLQMHSDWSDGSSTIAEMAAAALDRDYEYIAITDHAKGLKIAGGIDEEQLARQGREIESLNASIASSGKGFRVMRSIELNLNPKGEGDMSPASLARLDIVLGCFHSSLENWKIKRNAICRLYAIQRFKFSDIREAVSTTLGWGLVRTGSAFLAKLRSSTKQSRSMAIRIAKT